MANKKGLKWNKGGALARKKGFCIDYSAFEEYAEALDQLGADLKDVFSEAMDKAAETVQQDTLAAVEKPKLPALGYYSQGETRDSVITGSTTEWQGSVGTVYLGFDKTQEGAGGFLITGTPKMAPAGDLEKIYNRKTYAKKIKAQIEESLQEELRIWI